MSSSKKNNRRRCPTCWHFFNTFDPDAIGFYCSLRCLEIHAKHIPGIVCRVCHTCSTEFVTRDPGQRHCGLATCGQVTEGFTRGVDGILLRIQ